MANPRRNSSRESSEDQSLEWGWSVIIHFVKKPRALPFLLSIFLLLTWLSLRLQHHSFSSSSSLSASRVHQQQQQSDSMANLVRFSSAFPSRIAKDKRGWLLDPISLALHSRISGGAVTCASIHLGEIRPGSLRGNHRHHTCNETFILWGAQIKFRLENTQVDGKGYAEVDIGADEVVVAASPSGIAHALINVDPVRTAYFIGCQDNIIDYNSSSTDFNVWKNLQVPVYLGQSRRLIQ